MSELRPRSRRLPEPSRTLPPCRRSSRRRPAFVVQLFVLPFVVVAVVVLVYLLFGRLAGGERDVTDYVHEIRSTNANRRWRAAFELASLIQNDDDLARDPALLGTLAVELDRDPGRPRERPDPPPSTSPGPSAPSGCRRAARRADGDLDATAVLAEALATASRRRSASPPPRAWPGSPRRTRAAREHPEAVAALAGVLDDPNAEPELRQLAAFTLGFLGGEAAVGGPRRGRPRRGESDRFVRYNAAAALGRRGDESAAPVLREMLRPGRPLRR